MSEPDTMRAGELPACTLADVAKMTDGTILSGEPGLAIRGVSIDSRETRKDNLFVALPGERVDGHAFVEAIWKTGAAALVHRRPERLDGPAILIQDTLAALQLWAQRDLDAKPAKVVGITGSVGKTSIKEMTAAVLAAQFRVHRTRRNRNGQIGVAQTVLERPAGTEILVLEMGISLPGEMERIVTIAPPEVAVVNRLSQVHRENFPTFEALVSEKRRILLGARGKLPRVAVLHAELLASLLPLESRTITFGLDAAADVRVSDVAVEPAVDGVRPSGRFIVHGLGEGARTARLPFYGRAMAENAACALAVGQAFGVDPDAMIAALANLQVDAPMRQEWHAAGGIRWINDAYNASPASMRAALELLELCPGTSRRIAVLGDMLELGPESEELHAGLAEPVETGAEMLFTFGSRARALAKASRIPAEAFEDMDALIRRVLEVIQPGDLVLLKASRGMRLERVAEALEKRYAAG